MAEPHGVGMAREHDRDRFGCGECGCRFERGQGYNDVRASADEVRSKRRHLIGRCRPAELEDQVLAFHVANIAQAGSQRLYARRNACGRRRTEKADARDLPAPGLALPAATPTRPRVRL